MIRVDRALKATIEVWLATGVELNPIGEEIGVDRASTIRRRMDRLRYRNKVGYCEAVVRRAIHEAREADRL